MEPALYRAQMTGSVTKVFKKLLPSGTLNILIYTPDFCGFAKYKDENFRSLGGGDIKSSDIFELRAFCEAFELRWVRENDGGTGRGTILAELLSDDDGEEDAPQKVGRGTIFIESQDDVPELTKAEGEFFKLSGGRYLLWGKGKNGQLFEHRVGTLPVPVEVPDGQHVYLEFDEYFKADKYGNKVWYSKRLTGLSVVEKA